MKTEYTGRLRTGDWDRGRERTGSCDPVLKGRETASEMATR